MTLFAGRAYHLLVIGDVTATPMCLYSFSSGSSNGSHLLVSRLAASLLVDPQLLDLLRNSSPA